LVQLGIDRNANNLIIGISIVLGLFLLTILNKVLLQIFLFDKEEVPLQIASFNKNEVPLKNV